MFLSSLGKQVDLEKFISMFSISMGSIALYYGSLQIYNYMGLVDGLIREVGVILIITGLCVIWCGYHDIEPFSFG